MQHNPVRIRNQWFTVDSTVPSMESDNPRRARYPRAIGFAVLVSSSRAIRRTGRRARIQSVRIERVHSPELSHSIIAFNDG